MMKDLNFHLDEIILMSLQTEKQGQIKYLTSFELLANWQHSAYWGMEANPQLSSSCLLGAGPVWFLSLSTALFSLTADYAALPGT